MERVLLLLICFLLLSQPINCSSSLSFNSSTPLCHSHQSSALLHFRNSFSVGYSSYYCDLYSYPPKNSWKMGTNCCGWDGVTCDTMTGHVIAVDLSCSRLQGPIHPNTTLFSLRHLQRLNLAYNYFYGSTISSKFGGFANMTHLNLTESSVAGNFPSEISHLSKLVSLDLSWNYYMRIETPSLKRLVQNLTHLTELVLDDVNMSSVPPNSFMNLSSSLTSLRLSDCGLKGRFPDNIFHLPNLQLLDYLYLDNNQLTGQIDEFQHDSLRYLDLSNNNLHGHLPISIAKLVSLLYLDISFNNLSGSVEQNIFTKLKSLYEVDLSHNPLLSFHTYSYNIADYTLPELQDLSLSSCNISEFPYFLKSTENLYSLDLSNNQINGSIPTWLLEVKMDSLGYLNLSYNSLARIGHLPWKNLQVLDLHSNLLEGPLPIPPLYTYFFSVSRNNLTGEIPLLICNLSSLQYLDLSYNHLSNMIPPCLGNLSNHLIDLDLQSNNLHGTIPSTFAKGCYLRSLKLNGNQLEGSLPQSLVHCKKLEVLDFGNNKINGTFPLWLENLPKLQVLILRSNNFHGAIGNPKYKFPFPNLRIIDLSHNEFHGLLPTNFFKYLKAMKNSNADKGGLKYMGDRYYQDSVTVVIKGFFLDLVKIQSLFTTIDFSNNNFEGEIPKAIGELQSLKGLNFSHNNLSGHMPPSLGNLTNLEWLDLSSNKLIGEIPIQLADLTSLAVLNLSENHLFGQIPQGKQFNTFTNDSYNGNLGLCGFPMTKACGNDEGQQLLPSSTTQEDDFKFENGFNWKVVLLGYGVGFMFGLGLGYLVFSSGKPKWLVNIVYGGRHNKKNLLDANTNSRAVMLRSLWMTAMVIKINPYPIIP
ncbi:hypothetical protein CMV_022162 [Castanea mollissima]|uniref:Leucine-rich repeat-containing N-terminal plant-type domain-containing protein n=1 Tax=Castanea mollissima TaxID=60419 RepID=A0A8J4QTE4_9ROSI|nr:hypothetical protein CMV_022162 [Castanea mollissima]